MHGVNIWVEIALTVAVGAALWWAMYLWVMAPYRAGWRSSTRATAEQPQSSDSREINQWWKTRPSGAPGRIWFAFLFLIWLGSLWVYCQK